MMKYLFILAVILSAFNCQTAAEDKVEKFPGYPQTSFGIYSGMLNALSNGERQLHYILVESQNNPSTDPLVIWLNGGPGCSSLLGLTQENGPFLLTGINTFFSENLENSWNKRANVLYIEGPPGVGYSINNSKGYSYTDDNTAEDFLQAFLVFRDRFSSVLNFQNPLWLSGESYAGMYIPYFTKAILNYNKENPSQKFNIKGFLIGNGVFKMSNTLLTQYRMQQYVANNFFNEESSKHFYDGCAISYFSPKCSLFLPVFANITANTDAYSIYNYTYSYGKGPLTNQAQFLMNKSNPEDEMINEIIESLQYPEDSYSDEGSDTPSPMDIVNQYFNLDEVKKALHINPTQKWKECNMLINLRYKKAESSTPLYPEFFDAGLQILIFSGNNDGVVSTKYTKDNIEDLMNNYGVTFKEETSWRQWKPISTKQVGGMVQYWKPSENSSFVFAMVRAAGHEVPMYQPEAAFHMFDNFINGQPI